MSGRVKCPECGYLIRLRKDGRVGYHLRFPDDVWGRPCPAVGMKWTDATRKKESRP